MKEREKISRCAAAKISGKKKKSIVQILQMPPPSSNLPASLDEEWLKANTALSSSEKAVAADNSDENMQLVKCTVQSIANRITLVTESTPAFIELVTTLKDLLKIENIDAEIALNLCDILLALFDKNVITATPEDYVTIIYVLLANGRLSHEEKRSISLVKKLRKLISHVLESEPLKTSYLANKAKILPAARKLLMDTGFYATDSNRDIIAGLLSLHEELLREFHDKNKRFLVNCKRTEASAIGKIYHKVWEWSADNDRNKKYLEEECIQWLMDRAFTMGRQDASVRNLSLNLQSLLSSLHNCRKKAKFSKMLTTLYTPLLWKYLNSDNNVHRCNAAEIFMDVYPLEKPTEGKKVYSQFLRQQHEQMLVLLDDPCPAVRVIAIRGACSNMKYFWTTFQNGTSEEIIKKFVKDLVVDGSSAEVRKAVYQGLSQLLECKESHPLLKGVLPTLSEFINDENQAVRQAFIKMLIKIKDLQCDIKYWQVLNLHTAASRLENDSSSNRQLLVRLIFPSFLNGKITVEETFKRLCKFISLNSSASRYLALYSKNVLSFEKAVELMCTILLIMRNHLKKKMNVVSDENKNADDGEKPDKPRKTKSSVLASIENVSDAGMCTDEDVSSNETTSSSDNTHKSGSMSDPYIAHGLFDFVSMLWLIHGNKLLEEEQKEHLEKLYSIAVKCLCLSLRYFKDTHAFFGALYMAGMIPFSKLQYTTTILGICLSMLRQVSEESQVAEYHCVVHVLCLWNKGGEILELVKEWLDEALRAENLNESFSRRESRRIRRVKFATTGVRNPLLALNIVDELFASPTDQQCIFLKNRAELEDFLNYLSRIRVLIERRLSKGSEVNELLSDELIEKCLTIYGNLIIMFQENKVTDFNSWQQFSDHLEWCERTLVKGESAVAACQDEEKIKFIAKLEQVSLMQCWNVLALGKCTDEQLIVLIEYYLLVLNSESGMYAIEMTIYFTRQLIKYSRAHHLDNRQNEIMTVWFPRLLDKLLSLLTDKIYTRDMLLRFVKDLMTVRSNLIFTYLLMIKTYPDLFHYSNLSYKIMCTFCKHLINIFIFPIKECETLNIDESCKSLPYVGSLLTNVLISQVELASAFLYVLKTIVNRFTDADALQLLATASLLYTLSSFGDNKIRKSELMKIVKITYNKLQSITDEEGSLALVMNCEQTIGDRTIIDVQDTTKLAVKEVGKHILKLITERLGGSLS